MNTTIKNIEFTKVKNCINGNPRYVVHFLNFDNDYNTAYKKALSIGGKKYRAKHYGGGFVFTSYNLHDLAEKIILSMNTYEPNGTKEQIKMGILHSVDRYWVSNEGTKKNPSYHVWIPSVTHSVCDSAYTEIDLAVCRCNYLAKNKIKAHYQPAINKYN